MREILRLSLPFTVWIVGFCTIYALQGLSCSRHWPETVDPRTALIAAATVYVAGQGLVLHLIRRAPVTSVFAQRTATVVAVAALLAALWVSLPVMALSVCH